MGSLPPDLFDTTTILSLLATVAIVLTAHQLSTRVLSQSAPRSERILFIWHAANSLCHFLLEGAFLFHCLVSSAPAPVAPVWPTAPGFFRQDLATVPHVFGPQAAAASSPTARLWMVYARADRRWAGADPVVVSIELLTVFGGGPIAAIVCYCLAKRNPNAYIWMVVLATAELYGGFMTFAPEWLTGNPNLDGSNFMYLWVYLAFFNLLWVVLPGYTLWVAVHKISDALALRQDGNLQKEAIKKTT